MDAALGFETLGQVRIAIQSNAVRAQLGDLGQRAVKGRRALQGQAVDQVHVDGIKAALAGRMHQGEHLLGRLHAVHGFLHCRVKVLHAKAQAVKAHAGQCVDARHVHRARVNLDRQFGARRQLKMLLQQGHERAQLVVVHESGAAAAQMQLAHHAALADQVGVQRQFQGQVAQVFR